MKGFGSMITFELGSQSNANKVLRKLRVCSLGESLGGVETLISHPATMTHAALGADGRKAIGLTDGMVRISVGIEDVDAGHDHQLHRERREGADEDRLVLRDRRRAGGATAPDDDRSSRPEVANTSSRNGSRPMTFRTRGSIPRPCRCPGRCLEWAPIFGGPQGSSIARPRP